MKDCRQPRTDGGNYPCWGRLKSLYTRQAPAVRQTPRWVKVGTLCLRCKHLALEPAFRDSQR